MPDDVVLMRFSGSQLRFNGVKDANHGITAFLIDGGPEVDMDEYSAVRVAEALLFTGSWLSPGDRRPARGRSLAATGWCGGTIAFTVPTLRFGPTSQVASHLEGSLHAEALEGHLPQ